MPTLLEKSPDKSATPPTPPVILHTRHRWLHWRAVLVAGITGLAATLLLLWVVPAHVHGDHPLLRKEIWVGGILLTTIAATVGYLLSPRSLVATARKLDERFAAKNRLEAVAILQDSTSPLAQAQRDETALHLQREPQARPVRVFSWLVGLLLALIAAHLVSLLLWIWPVFGDPSKPAAPPPPKETPKASITWVSPEAETKANPIEEVPTVALAKSTSGLRNLTLEVDVNGTPKKSTPIPDQPYDKPGSNQIKASVYLDEVDAQPFDVVGYYLRGQRISGEKLPDITSPIQFIQVRPFRDDVEQNTGHGHKSYDLLIRLKLAQLRAVKEDFVLAHTDLPPDNAVRQQENERVGKNQAALAKKTDEVVQAFIADGMPAEMIDLLQQAEPFMDDAGKKILATQNAEAQPPQKKALDLIVQVEKFFHKAMGPATGPAGDDPSDPFKDKQKHEMTQRLKAPAGQLETLAKNQTQLSQDVDKPHGDSPAPSPAADAPAPAANASTPIGPGASPGPKLAEPLPPASQAGDPFGPDAEKGTLAERQTRVLQGISVLQNQNSVFPTGVNDALATAQRDATESLKQLAAGQDQAAREPAAAAARDLQQAVNALNQAGAEETKQAMSDAQQKLNDLASRLREMAGNPPPDAAKKLQDMANAVNNVRQNLNDAADRQQEAGSSQGADQLARLAEKLREQQFASKLADMAKGPLDQGRANALANDLEDAAGLAAHGQIPAKPSGQDYAALVNAFERSRANLERLAEKAGQTPAGANANPTGSPGAGPKPGDQAHGPGPNPAQGQAPSQIPGQQPGQGQGQQPSPSQGQGQGQGRGQGQGQQPSKGQGQGQGQSSDPNAMTGSGPGENPHGQGSGGSGDQAQGSGGGQGTPASPGGNEIPQPGALVDGTQPVSPGTLRAYREALEDLKNQTQQTSQLLHTQAVGDMGKLIQHQEDTTYRNVTPADVVHFYADLQKPLSQLINDLQDLQLHAQRTETVATPNLDDTPPAYRSAVSDYFESVSRDYHPAPAPPPPAPADEAKP